MLLPVTAEKERQRLGGRFVRIDASGIRSISRTLTSTEIAGQKSQLFCLYEKLARLRGWACIFRIGHCIGFKGTINPRGRRAYPKHVTRGRRAQPIRDV